MTQSLTPPPITQSPQPSLRDVLNNRLWVGDYRVNGLEIVETIFKDLPLETRQDGTQSNENAQDEISDDDSTSSNEGDSIRPTLSDTMHDSNDHNTEQDNPQPTMVPFVCARKITGDPWVPAPQLSWRLRQDFLPDIVLGEENNVDPLIIHGQGQIASYGFRTPSWIPGDLVVVSKDVMIFIFRNVGHVVYVSGEALDMDAPRPLTTQEESRFLEIAQRAFDAWSYEDASRIFLHRHNEVGMGIGPDEFERATEHIPADSLQQQLKNDDTQIDEKCLICCYEFFPSEEDSTEEDSTVDQDFAKILECSHVFHRDCLRKWLQRNKACPKCRTNVVGSQ